MNLIELFEITEPKSDKFRGHNYAEYYSGEFNPKREENLKILEIGVNYGYSMNLWSKFFINSEIIGVDISHQWGNLLDECANVQLYIADAYKDFHKELKDEYFDYIIEDGSHTYSDQLKAIELYYSKLKTGGKMIIEDIQGMGYGVELINYCKKQGFKHKFFDLRGREDDLILEITK